MSTLASSIINTVASYSGKTDKLEVLQNEAHCDLLKTAFYLALHPRRRYFFQERSFPEFTPAETSEQELDAETLTAITDRFYNREVTGNEAAEELKKVLESFDVEDAELIKKVILKDLKCGVSDKTANKVWKGLIPTTPYMRCSLPEKENNITYPAIVQTKADGAFCNVIIRNSHVEFVTRNGSPFELPTLGAEFLELGIDNVVLTGEITISDGDGGVLDRKTGNGMVNKLIKREQTQASYEKKMETANDKQKVRLTNKHEEHETELEIIEEETLIDLWDCIPLDLWEAGHDPSTYTSRMKRLGQHLQNNVSDRIKIIQTLRVDNKKEAQAFYQERVAEGLEGAVLKNLNMPWKDGTSTQQIKMKEVHDCDLEIIGWYGGKKGTTMEHGIGGFYLRSACGELEVSVGSGFTREQRGLEPVNPNNISEGLKVIEGFDFDQYTGKIAAVQFNAVDSAKGSDKMSLFLPILVEVREDKTEADTLEMIQNAVSDANKV